jgi:hypothetical protein
MTGGEAITITRASAKSCTRSDGVVVSIPAGVPSINWRGWHVEGSTTNAVYPSEQFDDPRWGTVSGTVTVTADNAIAPNLTVTADTLTAVTPGAIYRSPTAASTASSFIFPTTYVKGATTPGELRVWNVTTGAYVCTAPYTVSAAWQRTWCSPAAVTTGQQYQIHLLPGGASGTGSAAFWGADGSKSRGSMSSYVPSTTAEAVRPLENARFTPGTGVQAQGCFRIKFMVGWNVVGRGLGSTTTDSYMRTASNLNAAGSFAQDKMEFFDGTNTTSVELGASAAWTPATVRVGWSGSAVSMWSSGGYSSSGTFDGSIGGSAVIYFGSMNGSSFAGDLYVSEFVVGSSPTGCQAP